MIGSQRADVARLLSSLAPAMAWVLAWVLPWQPLLAGWPWLCAMIALLAFAVPGLCLHALLDDDRETSLLVRLPAGFCLSAGLTGLLGFIGSVAGLPSVTVPLGLVLAGAVGIVLLARRGGIALPHHESSDERFDRLLDLALLLLALALAARLCLAPALSSDDLTHGARVAAFQQRTQLGFRGIAFGGDNVIAPRYWLAFWPLAASILASLSGLEPLALTTNYLGAPLGVLATVAVFNLALALGLSRRLAVVAVLAQLAGLLVVSTRDQPGVLFFNRVVEDKFYALFVLAPIFLQIALAFLAAPSGKRLVCVAIAWLALMFSHATSLGMVALVVCAFCTLELLFARRRAALLVLAVVVPLTGAAAVVRFVPHVYQQRVFFDVDSARQEKEVTAARKRRVHQLHGTPFYGIGATSVGTTARILGTGMLALAALQARRRRVARYVLAALGVVAAAVVPYTGWLLGALLTPFHLWRILCLTPYGIATAFVVGLGLAARPLSGGRAPLAGRIVVAAAAATLAITTGLALRAGSRLAAAQIKPDWQSVLTLDDGWTRSYADLADLGRLLRREVGDGAVVLASRSLNDLVPSLATRATLVSFRSPMQTILHAGVPPDEARRRWQLHEGIVDGTTRADRAASLLVQSHVELVLIARDEPWLRRIPEAALPRTLVGSVGDVELYRLGTSERRS